MGLQIRRSTHPATDVGSLIRNRLLRYYVALLIYLRAAFYEHHVSLASCVALNSSECVSRLASESTYVSSFVGFSAGRALVNSTELTPANSVQLDGEAVPGPASVTAAAVKPAVPTACEQTPGGGVGNTGGTSTAFLLQARRPPGSFKEGEAARRLSGEKGSGTRLKRIFSKRHTLTGEGRGRLALKSVTQEIAHGTMPCTFPENPEPTSWLTLLGVLRKVAPAEDSLVLRELYPQSVLHRLQLGRRLRSTGPCLMLSIDGHGDTLDSGVEWALEVYAVSRRHSITFRQTMTLEALAFTEALTSALSPGTPPSQWRDSRVLIPYGILALEGGAKQALARVDNPGDFDVANVFVLRRQMRMSLETLIDVRNSNPCFVDTPLLTLALMSATTQVIGLVAHVHERSQAVKDLEASDFYVAPDGRLHLDPGKILRLESLASETHISALRSPPEHKSRDTLNCGRETDRWQLGFLLYQLWGGPCSGVDNPYTEYALARGSLAPFSCEKSCMPETPDPVKKLIEAFMQRSPQSRLDPVLARQTREFRDLLNQM